MQDGASDGEIPKFDGAGYDKDLVEALERDIVSRNPSIHWWVCLEESIVGVGGLLCFSLKPSSVTRVPSASAWEGLCADLLLMRWRSLLSA